jgi:hypothetical protein
MDLVAAEAWIREWVEPIGPIETAHVRPWATALRVPVAGGVVWFKACAPVQAFEPRLTAELCARWPDRVTDVIAHDEGRAWMLLADAGEAIGDLGNAPETWLAALPLYGELQRGEAARSVDRLAHGVPDLRVATLPSRLDELLRCELPLEDHEIDRLRGFQPRFEALCRELAACGVSDSVQHDDLHVWNLYTGDGRLRFLDWGDASISHPFASLVVTFRFLEEINGLRPGDAWFARIRDAYLEPWGSGLADVFALGFRIGTFAHAIAHLRQRDFLDEDARPEFDLSFAMELRRAIAQTVD